MSRRRRLHPEEEDLWNAVARTAKPLHGRSRAVAAKGADPQTHALQLPQSLDPHPHPPAKPRIESFRLGEKARLHSGHDIAPALSDSLAQQPVRMDAKAFGRMVRGKLAPEARIDLHGMTLAEAHPELIHFVLGSHAAGMRLVLVITGKGKRREDTGPIPQRMGALRHQVPQWLRVAPLGPVVLQVSEAHLKHGGSGAYYVYLRRR